jgi:YD repeat-containing protein
MSASSRRRAARHLQVARDSVLTFVCAGDARTAFTRQANGTFINMTTPAFRGTTITVNADGTRTLRSKDGRTTTFNTWVWGVGLPSTMGDATGNTLTVSHDELQNLVGLSDASGRGLTVTWAPLLHVTRIADPIGRAVIYGYDDANRLTAVTNPAGGVTSYTYDAQSRMTTITDARGLTFLTNTYDVNSRVCQQSQADGGVFTMFYITADIATTPASLQLLDEAAAGGPISQTPCSATASSSPVVATVLVDPRGPQPAQRRHGARGLTCERWSGNPRAPLGSLRRREGQLPVTPGTLNIGVSSPSVVLPIVSSIRSTVGGISVDVRRSRKARSAR